MKSAPKLLLILMALLLLTVASTQVLEAHEHEDLKTALSLEAIPNAHARVRSRSSKSLKRSAASSSAMMARTENLGESDEAIGHYGAVSEDQELGGETLGKAVRKSLDQAMDELSNTTPVERMLIHNGQMSLSTKTGECKSTVENIKEIISTDGGYVESQNVHSETYYKYGRNMSVEKTRIMMDLVLRIPSDKFHKFLATLQDMVGTDRVQNLSTNSKDVTDSYVDASSRAETLYASRKAMQVLLEKANSVKEVMDVQRELDRLTQDYESLKSRANSLKKQSSLSTLRLSLAEEKEESEPAAAPPPDEPWFSPLRTARKAMEDVASIFAVAIEIFVYASILAVALGAPCYLSYLLFGPCLKRQISKGCLG